MSNNLGFWSYQNLFCDNKLIIYLLKIGICSGDSGGPLTFFNGTHSILVGVTSFTWGKVCEGVGQIDGFAKVSHVMDWIREFGDDYVNSCSARSAPEIIENPA